MISLRQQAGVALITALIFTALVTTFAVAIASQQQIDIRRTGNILSSDRGYLLALGIEDWARDVLQKDIADVEGEPIDHLGEDWNVALPPIQIEGATVTGKITDLQGLINVNGLVNDSGQPVTVEVQRFRRLLELFDFDPDITDALVDWIDSGTEVTIPSGAEDSYYLSKAPSYRTANAPMVSISELRLVAGFDREVYTALSPFLTALPAATNTTNNNQTGSNNQGNSNNQQPNQNGTNANNSTSNSSGTPININTAPLEILRVLTDPPLSELEAESLLEDREAEEGFKSQTEFLEHAVIVGTNLTQASAGNNGLAISSEYFLIEGTAVLVDAQMHLFSVVRRDNGNLTVLIRGQGSY